jgi:hypothetical protein
MNAFLVRLFGLAERSVLALEVIAAAQRDIAIALGVLAQRRSAQPRRRADGLSGRGG